MSQTFKIETRIVYKYVLFKNNPMKKLDVTFRNTCLYWQFYGTLFSNKLIINKTNLFSPNQIVESRKLELSRYEEPGSFSFTLEV